MENKVTYTKLSSLVGDQFTITEAGGWKFKKWNNEAKRMEVSDTYEEGFRKMYTVDTDKGRMDLGSGQLGNLLEIAYYKGESSLNGKTFTVKSNGKSGMDIRYFFNLKREPRGDGDGFNKFKQANEKLKESQVFDSIVEDFDETQPIDLSEIPF